MGRRTPPGKLLVTVGLVTAALLAVLAGAQTSAVPRRPKIPLGLDLYLPCPEDNPLTAEKVALGRKLFFDPMLSRDETLACASCHDPRRAFTDGRAVSLGVFGRKGTRSAPSLINRGYGVSHFWDGRTSSLEEQVLQPVQNPKELDMTVEEVVARLKQDQDYPKLFQASFARAISREDLARALASYVRTILSGNAPIDRYLNGEREALSERQRQGLHIFRGKGQCTACHVGPNFTDERFHNTGVAWQRGALLDDGRFRVSGKAEDRGAFKTPTLREVTRTAPYMHDGSLETLEDVIDFYDRGGNPNPYLDSELRRLNLTSTEKEALVTFLHALSGRVQDGMSATAHF